MSRVIDYAWNRPGAAALKAAGAVAVCRYLSYDTTGKTLSKSEADGLRASGVDIVSNWEQAGSWSEYSGGQTTGRSHAAEANRQHIACGGPPTRPIYFSTDWGATSTQFGAIAEYYRGVASVIGLARTGAYGGYPVIKYLFDQGVITWGWQTYAWSSYRDDPSGQIYLHWDQRAQLRQVQNGVTVGGVDCDLDDSMAADFGQWGMAEEMEQGDTVQGWNGQGRKVAIGWALQDAENWRDWWYGNGDTQPWYPPAGSRAARLMQATDVILSGRVDSALAAAVAALAETQATTVAVAALAQAVAAGGGSVDVAAVVAAVQQAGQTESAAVSRLSDQLAAAQARERDLHVRLAAALDSDA